MDFEPGRSVSSTNPLPTSSGSSGITAVAVGDGQVATTPETITLPSGTQSFEIFNKGASRIWASWTETAAVNGAGSFPIAAMDPDTKLAGFYAAPSGMSGNFSIVAEAGTCAYSAVRGDPA